MAHLGQLSIIIIGETFLHRVGHIGCKMRVQVQTQDKLGRKLEKMKKSQTKVRGRRPLKKEPGTWSWSPDLT